MEKITYRLTLDVHKTGIQKTLQGFQTADNISRRIAVSLVAGSDTYEIDSASVVAMMYVTTPNATEPSINTCTIEDNTIIYDALPIVEEGLTRMQVKLIKGNMGGADSVLVSPEFMVEVSESSAHDSGAEQSTTFTALEQAIVQANGVYNARLLRVDISDDCIFRAYYADGTVYENSNIKKEVRSCVSERLDIDFESIHKSATQALSSEEKAKVSEINAKTSEVSAKTSELNASASEEMARQYAEQAFSGTPAGYEQLVEDVRLMDIKTTTDTTLANSKAGGYKLVSMSGNRVQDGEPTPDYPIAIQHTGDCVEMINGYYNTSTGVYVTSKTAVCSKNFIPCKAGDSIKVTYPNTVSQIRICYYNNGAYVNHLRADNVLEYTFTVPSNATEFNVCIVDTKEIIPDTVGKITLTINDKYVLQIKGHGKNFFSYDKATTTLVKSSARYKTIVTSKRVVLKAGTYNLIMSDLVVANNTKPLIARLLDNTGIAIASNIAMQKKDNIYVAKFTANSDSLLGSLYLFLDTNDNDNATATFSEIMIVKDDVTDYTFEEYKESVATILLDEPLRDGDVLFKENGIWKVERKMAEVVFDGSDDEGWGAWGTSYPNAFYHSLASLGLSINSTALCSHYSQITNSEINAVDYGIATQNYLTIKDVDCSTVNELKTKLASNPIEVECELAEEVIEELDTDSQIALNSLETFNGATYITVDSRTPPSEIVSEYGTSIVGARTLKNELKNDTLEIKYNELAVALVATE